MYSFEDSNMYRSLFHLQDSIHDSIFPEGGLFKALKNSQYNVACSF